MTITSLRTACIREYPPFIWILVKPLRVDVLPDGSRVAVYWQSTPDCPVFFELPEPIESEPQFQRL